MCKFDLLVAAYCSMYLGRGYQRTLAYPLVPRKLIYGKRGKRLPSQCGRGLPVTDGARVVLDRTATCQNGNSSQCPKSIGIAANSVSNCDDIFICGMCEDVNAENQAVEREGELVIVVFVTCGPQ